MGGSYGGYATLVGLTFTPDVFACGVDIVGPSNLVTLLSTIPPYWEPFMTDVQRRASAIRRTEEGKKLLDERSPLTQRRQDQEAAADRPGRQRPARQAGRGRPDRQGDEGEEHPGDLRAVSRRRPRLRAAEQPLSFNAVTEASSRQYLGGRYEPIGNDFKGATSKCPRAQQTCPAWPTP